MLMRDSTYPKKTAMSGITELLKQSPNINSSLH